MIKALPSIFAIILFLYALPSFGKRIHIGIEPFPPLITENSQGYVVDMLKSLEKDSDLTFVFHIMTYARAKIELKNQRLDMIALIPKGNETSEFYQYGQDLNWGINANVDLFAIKQSALNIKSLPLHSIGTLRGNADFFAELLEIPRDKFVEISTLKQLVKMLQINRLDAVVFERASMMGTIKKLNVPSIFYRNMITIQAGIAVQKTVAGSILKNELDTYLLNNNRYKQHFTDYFQYDSLPKSGQVAVSSPLK